MNRRHFLSRSVLVGGASLIAPVARAAGANEALRVAVIGLRGRGGHHLDALMRIKGVRVAAVCDVDPAVLRRKLDELDRKGVKATGYSDYRKLCESGEVDAVTIATPNHTHALIAITAASQGKHVYVEKPVSHNVEEGRLLARAQEKYGVHIQHGFQRRCERAWQEAFAWIGEGHLGKLTLARGLCYKPRPSIGKVSGPQLAPEGLDYDLWCGPRPRVPIRRKRFHYDWHWQMPWGNGDLGNQGPHQLDVCRWALGDPDDLPRSVLSCGDRFAHDDDGQWANTQLVWLEYAAAPILFEVRGLPRKGVDYDSGMDQYRGVSIGNVIEYEGGALIGGHGAGCRVVDRDGKELRRFSGGGDAFRTWVEQLRAGRQDPVLGAESGHLSSALAHLGNISWQLGQAGTSPGDEAPGPYAEAFRRMATHLEANGVDVAKRGLRVGPRLGLVAGQERISGPIGELANPLLSEPFRTEFLPPL